MYRFFKRNREAVKKYLLIFFLSIVSIGMVITLAPIPTGDTSRAESNVLASIGGLNITTTDLQRTIQTRFRNSQVNQARIIPAVAGNVLDEMILQRALISQAKKMGIEVSDVELGQALQSIPWLMQGGSFVGMDRYTDLIYQQTGMSVAEFEAELRSRLLQDKIRSVVTDGAQVSSQEVREEFQHRNTKAKIEYVLFDPSQFIKAVQVSSEALEGFFKKDPDRYKVPEERKVRYVVISPDDVRGKVKVGDEEARQYYTQHLSDYRIPDRVKVAHILFKTTGKTPAEAAAIEKKAHDALSQIKGGADFAELAKKYSDDTTASNGGELGWVVRGQTVKEFENTAFAMKPGEVSGLVRTVYGIHILKLEDKQTAHLQSFDEVKGTIIADFEKQRIADAQDKLANDLVSELRLKPGAFEEVVRKAGAEPKVSPPFRYGQAMADLGSGDTFENLAFQLHKGEVGTPISVPKGQAIIQLADIVPEHVPTLEEVRARVEEDYRAQQSKVLAADKAKQFAAQVKRGDFAKVAKADGLTAKESKDFTQQDFVEGVGSGSELSSAFTLNVGQTSDVITLGGKSVVFRVVSHTAPNDADFAQQRDQITEELLDRKRSLAFELYRDNLKLQLIRTGELKLNAAALQQFIALYQKQ
ncbi:MAG TPA: peptidyl-prolyl cis-trans isomerase [Terriglobia bacterium]|nr:peptidyl-prolyl cis-trans isomerase [Terriglobia bacterium]